MSLGLRAESAIYFPALHRGWMLTEADTCTRFVVPLLRSAGWDDAPHSFAQEHCFTDGRILLTGNRVRSTGFPSALPSCLLSTALLSPLSRSAADFLLQYTGDFTIAVGEAKSEDRPAGEGLQRAKVYAGVLGFKFN
jgi:type I restriction enzyme R subunit